MIPLNSEVKIRAITADPYVAGISDNLWAFRFPLETHAYCPRIGQQLVVNNLRFV